MILEDLLAIEPRLKPYHEFLKPYLPPKIEVYPLEELERYGFKVRESIMACAVKPNKLFFRFIPPSISTFVHELIHLCDKPPIDEEVYGYNLTDLVVFMVDEGLSGNPFKLFTLEKAKVVDVLRKFGYNGFEEFYEVFGVIPINYEFTEEGLKPEEGLTERDEVLIFLTEVIAGLPHFEVCRLIVKGLIQFL